MSAALKATLWLAFPDCLGSSWWKRVRVMAPRTPRATNALIFGCFAACVCFCLMLYGLQA